MKLICHSKAHVDRHNHYGHNGTRDSEVTHAFDGSTPLVLESSSQERIEAIRLIDYQTLREMIMNAKFSIPNEDMSRKTHFLFGDSNPNGTSIFNWQDYWYDT
ncbi:uncharacterized protein A4U43_C02F11450 [Asparagus officinalis]|uniref:Uncharacterized protein n=1 Tax=Asparagus officinalis TaxID=4686 RepID=A0A5P1FHR3_ASPOF|nr:uncharacterized protein A4U43_C02F11450 [Asparagus officinalis]